MRPAAPASKPRTRTSPVSSNTPGETCERALVLSVWKIAEVSDRSPLNRSHFAPASYFELDPLVRDGGAPVVGLVSAGDARHIGR